MNVPKRIKTLARSPKVYYPAMLHVVMECDKSEQERQSMQGHKTFINLSSGSGRIIFDIIRQTGLRRRISSSRQKVEVVHLKNPEDCCGCASRSKGGGIKPLCLGS